MLIVGLSRVANSRQLAVATQQRQRATVGFCGNVRNGDLNPDAELQTWASNYAEEADGESELDEDAFQCDDDEDDEEATRTRRRSRRGTTATRRSECD
jgi:hypothetical protein